MNGMAVSGLVPAGGTFFVFSDYMRRAVRLAALSQYKTAFVWSHDSVGVGEDGPTHQPIEHLASMRAMPGCDSSARRRQRDRAGVAGAHRRRRPHRAHPHAGKAPGARATRRRAPEGVPARRVRARRRDGDDLDLVLIGTGSEVSVCVDACEQLAADGYGAGRVDAVVGPLRRADRRVRDAVLPPDVPTLASRRARRSGGSATPTTSSASIASARRRPDTVLDELGYQPGPRRRNVHSRCWPRRRDLMTSAIAR
jgi:transketolase